MFVDHMHLPWRTLAAIINKCLSGKTTCNDKLRKSIIDILWEMFNRENVDYPELIWEDLAYQIDHKKEKKLKFVRISKDYQEYGLYIPDIMLTEEIKRLESYQMFYKYSTSQIPPKKSRDKGSQGKKTTDAPVEEVEVSEGSELEPKLVKKRTSSKKRVKKTVTIYAEDNIILGPDIATHARIMTESIPTPARRRTFDPPKKLKSVLSLITEEQEVANIMIPLKESRKSSKRQPDNGGSHKGTGSKPGVPDESTVVSATSSKGSGVKPGVPDEEKDITKEKVILEWGEDQDRKHDDDANANAKDDDKDDYADDEGDDEHISKAQDTDDEEAETESDTAEIYKYKIHVHKDTDEEMGEPETIDKEKREKEELTDAAKLILKRVQKKILQKQMSVLDGYHYPTRDSSDPVSISSEVTPIISPVQQSTTLIPPLPVITDIPTVTTVVSELDALNAVQLRVANLEKDVSKLKKLDISAEAFAALKTHVPTVVNNYLGSKVRDVFQKELQKHKTNLIHKYSLQHLHELTKKQTPTIDLEQESERVIQRFLSSRRNMLRSNRRHSLPSSLQTRQLSKNHKRKHDDDDDDDDDDNEDPSARPNQGKTMKRRRTKESVSSQKPYATKDTSKGNAPSKGSKIDKSASAKEPVEEPIAKLEKDNVGEDMVRDADQPQHSSQPKKDKTPKWFKQPPRSPTLDLE
ncbi:hypothetical protein Tco_1231413 [Tanacetum coccineum]